MPVFLPAHNVPALLEERVPHLVLLALLLLPHLLALARDVEEDGERERLEVVEEAEPPPFQLQADQGGDVDAVAERTVGVPEGSVLAVDEAGVGGAPLGSLLGRTRRAGGDEGRGRAAPYSRLQGLWEVGVQVALMENRGDALDGLELNSPLAGAALLWLEHEALRKQALADVVEPRVVTLKRHGFTFLYEM